VPCSTATLAAVSLLLSWQEALTTSQSALGSSAQVAQAQPASWGELITTCLSLHSKSCNVLVHQRG